MIFVATACCIGAYLLFRLIRYGDSGRWPETPARVESYDKYRHLDGAGSRSLSFADIAYSYTIDGNFYSGRFLSPTLQDDAALTVFLQKRLPVGQQITVRYNPRHPERSIIAEEISAREEEITRLNLE